MKKIFQDSELEFFEKASFDRNPLHRDDSYARKTQFGQTVVYGMYATLFALGEWLAGRNIRLSTIKGEFKKPLLTGTEYDLTVNESSTRTDITVSRNGTKYLKLRIGPASIKNLPFHWPKSPSFSPRVDAADSVQFPETDTLEIPGTRYSSGWNGGLQPPPLFRLRRDQLPFEQLTAFLWSSYFAGMEVPGRQALFSAFEFNFESAESSADDFQISPLRVELDRRFNRLTIQGTATGIRSLTISSFERPVSVQISLDAIRKSVGTGPSMAGKKVLITGASRGFGAVLAQTFALQGAQIFLNFFQSRQEAEALVQNIAAIGPRPVLIQGNAANPQEWKSVKGEVGAIDFLINNASPVIPAINFKEQSAEDIVSFVSRSLELFLVPCSQLLPQMSPGGTVIQISSVFVTQPEAGFSHYVAAKSAAEAVMRSLAEEYSDLRFLIFRAPRMLTDQTNTVVPIQNMSSPSDVAKVLLDCLDKFEPQKNFQLFVGM